MLIQDLFGFIRRNSKKWNAYQLNKMLTEINQIQNYLEKKIRESV
jgi:hypothetical protein